MNRNKTIDLKKYGVIQDLKEAKGDKTFAKRLDSRITKIKEEGKERENRYEEKRIKLKEGIERLKKDAKEDKDDSYFYNKERKKLERKYKGYGVAKVGSKIESGVHRALESATSRLGQALKQRIISRKVLKPNKMEVHIKERTPESSWNDENRFFKGNYNKEKRSMYFE